MKTKVLSIVKILLQFAVLLAFALFLCQNILAQESDLIMYEPTETHSEIQTATTTEHKQPAPQTGEKNGIIVPSIAAICVAGVGLTAFLIDKRRNTN